MRWRCYGVVLAVHALAWWLALDRFDFGPGDDLAYWRTGLAWRAGEFSGDGAAWSPVFVACNALVSLFDDLVQSLVGVVPIHGVHWLSLAVGGASAVAVAFCVRAVAPSSVAVIAGAWWTGCWFRFAFGLNVMLIQTVFWGFAVGFLLRGRWGWGLPWIVCAVVDRAEGLLWLGALTAMVWLVPSARADRSRRNALTLATVLLVAWVALTPGRSPRAWLAFGQHYAVTLQQRLGGEIVVDGGRLDPWVDWERVVGARFETAHSPLQALREDPVEVMRHVGTNATALPRSVRKALLSPLGFHSGIATALMVVLLFRIAWCVWRRRRDAMGLWPPVPRSLVWVSVSGLALVAVPLGLHPRPEFLAAWAGVALAWCAVLASGSRGATGVPSAGQCDGFHRAESRRAVGLAVVAMFVITAVVVWKRDGVAARTPRRDAWLVLDRHLDPSRPAVVVGRDARDAVGWCAASKWEPVSVVTASRERWGDGLDQAFRLANGRPVYALLPSPGERSNPLVEVRNSVQQAGGRVVGEVGELALVRLGPDGLPR